MIWHKVKASHEEAQETSLGPWPGDQFLGVALPSTKALRKKVVVRYEDKEVEATVADVGPWTIDDDEYVFGDAQPRAEINKGKAFPTTKNGKQTPSVPDGKGGFRDTPVSNGSGIDLFPATAKALGIELNDNVIVSWAFKEE